MNFVAFDIEISDVFDLKPGEDIHKHGPFNVCIAATAAADGEERLWYSAGKDGRPTERMTAQTSRELLAHLDDLQGRGGAVCAWNGLNFDLRWLAHAADDLATARRIALRLYDPMFQFFNQRGFPVGLEAVAAGMGLKARKTLTGEQAPKLWRAGKHEQVMEYVRQDASLTRQVVAAIVKQRRLSWITSKGQRSSEPMARLKTVEELLREPEPDQSWMDRRIPRAQFTGWLSD